MLHSAHSDSSSDVILPPAHQGLPQPPASAGAPEVVEVHDFEDVSEFEEYSPEPPVASTQPAAVPQIVAPPVVVRTFSPKYAINTPLGIGYRWQFINGKGTFPTGRWLAGT